MWRRQTKSGTAMRVALAPFESHVLKLAAADFKGKGHEVAEIAGEDVARATEALVEKVVESADCLVVDIPKSLSFVRVLVSLERSRPELFTGKSVVGLTSIASWGRTQGESVSDADETRRAPTPGALPILEAERLLMTCECSQVLCHGILYGSGECEAGLKPLFDEAFNEGVVTLCGEGANNLPLVNCKEVVQFLDLAVTSRLAKKYCLVVDENENSARAVAEAVAESFGARVRAASVGETLLLEGPGPAEHLHLDLKPECTKVEDYVFQFSAGLASELRAVAADYIGSLGYTPRAYLVSGPPGSGKTFFAKSLCERFGLEYISKEEVEAVQLTGEVEEEIDEEKALLAKFRVIMGKPNIENKGYVLDGFPSTVQEACKLFPNPALQEKPEEAPPAGEGSEAEAEAEPAEEEPEQRALFRPGVAISLRAEDSTLQERAAAAAGGDAGDFAARNSAFKKGLEEDKKQLQELLKRLDAQADDGEAEGEGGEAGSKAKAEEVAQASALGAYFAFAGSKFVDFDNNRKEVVGAAAGAPEGGDGETAEEGEGDSAEPEPEFSPLEALLGKIEGEAEDADAGEEAAAEAPAEENAESAEATDKVEPQATAPRHVGTVDTDIDQLEDLEVLVKPVKAYLARELGPAISEGFIKLAEARPDDPVKFLGEFLVQKAGESSA